MAEKSTSTLIDRFRAQVEQRNLNDRALIEGPLVHLSDKELQNDVREFSKYIPDVEYEDVLRAARVAKDIRTYDQVARNSATQTNLLVALEENEKKGLVSEHDELRGQFRQIFPVILTVGCAAFLQGHVQASINCASLYLQCLENTEGTLDGCPAPLDGRLWQWKLGAANSSPFFAAAIIGAPSALLLNFWVGRRGAITVAALLILASSLGSAWATSWWQLLCIRIVNGVGMGIKAISTPILAGEMAYTQWRGSSTLMWQLWVAFGIAIGSILNLGIASWNNATDSNDSRENQIQALREILGAPFIPAVILLIALGWCVESPRYYMQPNTPYHNPSRAYNILLKARQTKLQALRDLYLIHKSVELDEYRVTPAEDENAGMSHAKAGLTYANQFWTAMSYCSKQYALLFRQINLRNAVLSTCVVALAQQLCGINVFAFYSNTFFANSIKDSDKLKAMGYSAGFGAVNFVFCLLAIRRIDTWGRRKLMLTTLPLMSLCLAAAAMLFINRIHLEPIVVFIYLFAAVYSPSLGPIPFTLASESFPLAQREAGCSVAIAVNLFFAGVLTLVYPELDRAFNHWGALALFAAFNLVAFVLVFLLVEETKGFSLEDLSMVFAVPKHKFIAFQLKYLGYLWRRHVRGSKKDEPEEEEPEFYTMALDLHHENQPEAGVHSGEESEFSDG
ncbi:hypothetical protein N8I77_012133 [Diaporthe amygdali]|uniref:Major facilitator superfamily (MFS) profile domain-containing protein n=1 Tax=Phomopsis amygdali TaxID=1214568 RepID=A0AAD9S5K9_PHOAM|nr:hypothetical protein N8I77_012133 [Diaporthe amygdali]